MTTQQQLDVAYAHAQSLHAALSSFTLETLDPAAKAMWSQYTQSAQRILQGIETRQRQLRQREETLPYSRSST